MEQPDKLLHREQVIRIAGFMLLLAPFANVYMTILPLDIPNKWTVAFIWDFLKNGSVLHWIMQLANFVVGFMMLKGRRASWMPVLVILFVFIAAGVYKYRAHTARGAFLPTFALALNIGLFLLVYYQEYWQITYGHLKKLTPDAQPGSSKTTADFLIMLGKVQAPIPGANSSSNAEDEPTSPVFKIDGQDIQVETRSIVAPEVRPDVEPEVRTEAENPDGHAFPGTISELAPASKLVELKQVLPAAPPPPPPKVQPNFELSLLIGFFLEYEDGPWAYIDRATQNEIHVEIFGKAPVEIDTKKFEIPVGNAAILQFSLVKKSQTQASFRLEKIILNETLAG